MELTRTLEAAFAQGLLSEDTFLLRVDRLLDGHLIDPRDLIGDLDSRATTAGVAPRIGVRLRTAAGRVQRLFTEPAASAPALLALDWNGGERELVLGRHRGCEVVLADPTVSRRHARLVYDADRWTLQDLGSRNGTLVNGRRIDVCPLNPGDRVQLGAQRLRID
jgi:hypothetical protein